MNRLYGNISGLKAAHIKKLQSLYKRRIPKNYLISYDLARDMARISHETRRQTGILIDRRGKVAAVIIGDTHKIVIPDTPDYRTLPGRLKGLRCIHTHIKDEPLTEDDLTDLALLRLDMMAAMTINANGGLKKIYPAHILPKEGKKGPYEIMEPLLPNELDMGCDRITEALEEELAGIRALYKGKKGQERAILVSVTSLPKKLAGYSMSELGELAGSCGIHVVDTVFQYKKKADARFLMGMGKLQELNLLALQKGISLIIFDQELNPSQIRSITDRVELKVIDRTQLILDIFAQRALTKEGRLQVELAQLKYLLPRLIYKNTAMSRLTGGIGGRGPGETKLEINRRRVRDRIRRLEKSLSQVIKHRKRQKSKRLKKGLPIISIIGYTNAGKSTLLNTLTHSRIPAENRLFATLDPSSRRLRFPEDKEVIITDTVGFIRDLPRELMVAFRATLEELKSANLLLHVIDISNPRFKDQIKSVEKILTDLNLSQIDMIRVLNKKDRIKKDQILKIQKETNGIPVSALNRSTLLPLIKKMEKKIERLW